MTTQTITLDKTKLYNSLDLKTKYTISGELGKGSFGTVFKGTMVGKEAKKPVTKEEMKYRRGTLLQLPPYTTGKREYGYHPLAIKKLGSHKECKEWEGLSSFEKWANEREIQFALSMRPHPNLVQLYDMFVDDSDKKLTIVMELMEADLLYLIKGKARLQVDLPSGFDKIQYNAKEILKGLIHIHQSGFLHRDLKCHNTLLVSNPEYEPLNNSPDAPVPYFVKISDFGLGIRFGTHSAVSGTRGYMAPEMRAETYFKGREFHYTSGATDIWSFGALVYHMATGRMIYERNNEEEINARPELYALPYIRMIGTPSDTSPYGDSQIVRAYLERRIGGRYYDLMKKYRHADEVEKHILDPELRDVIRACLQWDPSYRPTAEDLFKMPYFSH